MRITITPPCPKCNSLKTGYYIHGSGGRSDIKEQEKRFIHGERVQFYYLSKPHKNCYCSVCHYHWHAELHFTKVSKQEFGKYLQEHGFYEERNNRIKRSSKKKMKKPKSKVNKSLLYKIGTYILLFATGLDFRELNPFEKKDKK